MKLIAVLLFCFFAFVCAQNCNRGLTSGNYYCFHNAVPFQMLVAESAFEITPHAWGCTQQLRGHIDILGRSITLTYQDYDKCPEFTNYLLKTNYNVSFKENCVGFQGIQVDDSANIKCTLEEYYFVDEITTVVSSNNNSAILLPLSIISFVILLVL